MFFSCIIDTGEKKNDAIFSTISNVFFSLYLEEKNLINANVWNVRNAFIDQYHEKKMYTLKRSI